MSTHVKKILAALVLAAMVALPVMAGGSAEKSTASAQAEGKLGIVSTTTMLTDLFIQIGGDRVQVTGLMGPGVDPHLYQATAGDVRLLQGAEVVAYQGLHLEAKMIDVFNAIGRSGTHVIALEKGIPENRLLSWDDSSPYDPHIWFDTSLWKDGARYVARRLTEIDPDGKDVYSGNLLAYLKELDDLDVYIKDRVAEVPAQSRVLVTAHDAFNYFGRAYGFEVRGLQGISTESEAGTADVSQLAGFIVQRSLKAIFIESSVPRKNVEALQAAVAARGFTVAIGGELYSDALGDASGGAGTYVGMYKANIDTIVGALK